MDRSLNGGTRKSAGLIVPLALASVVLRAISAQSTLESPWVNDFALQPVEKRPALDVRYVDGRREAFEVSAAAYDLIGDLRRPHVLKDARSGAAWLRFSLQAGDGKEYSTALSDQPSRINLYRRGPYYCEVHWLDITFASRDGDLAPLKGDAALYCYPSKLLASLTVHATADVSGARVRVTGVADRTFALEGDARGKVESFAFPLFGEEPPLPPHSLETLEGEAALRYDSVRGCYVIGSHNPGGFQDHFYRHPNHYETAGLRVTNDETPRMVYVCHETVSGAAGTVEGGILLDGEGHPLPVTVQISKNFSGEKEEKLYNPTDRAFSETWFPLVLGAGESCTVTSLHLYQNWGRHMVKQFSSLGAWMDYFHSSTGVTETTCYVPFKFAGLRGVAIADFRAMSQTSFWGGQPQHDNVAGHSYLSYHDGERWQYLTYRGTTYHSTGPNWMDVTLEYVSTDGRMHASLRAFELPQSDELRSFFRLRYEALAALRVDNARENFRLLTIASWVQRLRYSHFAATGHPATRLTFDREHFAVRGAALPRASAYMALYGEPKGSNAIVLRRWSASVGPAASVLCETSGDTRLLLVPDADRLELKKGDAIEIDAMWLPYGETSGVETPERETLLFGGGSPRIERVDKGTRVQDFPAMVRAEKNQAELVLRGGRGPIPVIVTGLSDYRWPRIERQEGSGWRRVRHDRVTDRDGLQVFSDVDGGFGAVFLVDADDEAARFRVSTGEAPVAGKRLSVEPVSGAGDEDGNADGDDAASVRILAPGMKAPLRAVMARAVRAGDATVASHPAWKTSAGGSWWHEVRHRSGALGERWTPNEDDIDLELWFDHRDGEGARITVVSVLDSGGTIFEDPELERTWIHDGSRWTLARSRLEAGARKGRVAADLVAVVAADGARVVSVVWPRSSGARHELTGSGIITETVWGECPPGRRLHSRGKLYLLEGTLDDLYRRARRELPGR